MLKIRKSAARGYAKHVWLETKHSFSFGNYYDESYTGFRQLRVINQDIVQPGQGFPTHSHQNMEIISYVIEGTLAHQDSLGTGSLIKPGEIQRMTAGSGIEHSEFNYSKNSLLHFLQIWIVPDTLGLTPSYEQKTIEKMLNELILIGSQQASAGSVTIHQDIALYVAYLEQNHSIHYAFKKGRYGWLQLIKGTLDVNGQQLSAGDGMAIIDESEIKLTGSLAAELLLFDLA